MAIVMRTADRTRYEFRDGECIGRGCFAPGYFENRRPCCVRREHHGCPAQGTGEFVATKGLELARKRDGWRVVA
jgi:hypothetical protein